MDEGPLEEVSVHEENYEGSKSSLSETYDTRDFCPGIRIEAQDFDGKWYPAKVADVDWTENEILVHFENRNTKFDEWIPMDSSRLRSLPKPLSQTQKDAVKFVKGEEVMAMWSPYQKYPATIQAVLSNDRYDVLFYDGFLKRLKAQKISKAEGGQVRSEVRNFSDIGTKEERRERKRKINVAELFHVNRRTKKKGLIHSKTQQMKTYPVNKSHAKSSIIKRSIQLPQNKDHASGSESTLSKQYDIKAPAQSTGSYVSRSLIDTIPAAVEVKYIDGRTEMWSKQLYQRSEGRTAGKLDIVILNPQGRKFRSRNEIMKYCEENGIIYTHEAFDFSAKGRPKSKSVVQGLPAKPEITSEESDKMLLKKFWRKPQIEECLPGTSSTQASPVPVESGNFVEDKVFIGDVEVVIENGKFICPVKICGKHFRRENLLHMHVKHYHPEFSKYLDYTPSVTDLAYMRTVGSLETSEPLLSAPRKSALPTDKVEKTAVKVEKSTKSNILVNEGNKEIKKASQKSFEGKVESKILTGKVTSHAIPSSSVNTLPESSEENKSHDSVPDTLQILKNTVPLSSSQTITHESKGSALQEPLVEIEAVETEDLASSSNVSKAVKHNRFYRQKKSSRIRGSFVDRIKKKNIGQELSRSTAKLGRQQQTQTTRPPTPLELPSHSLTEDQSSSVTSNQPLLTPKTPKMQLSVPNEINDFPMFKSNKSKSESEYYTHKQKRMREKQSGQITSSHNTDSSNLIKSETTFQDNGKEKNSLAASNRELLHKNIKNNKCTKRCIRKRVSRAKRAGNSFWSGASKKVTLNIKDMDKVARERFERHVQSCRVILENIFHNEKYPERKIKQLVRRVLQEKRQNAPKTALKKCSEKSSKIPSQPVAAKKRVRFQDLVTSSSESGDENYLRSVSRRRRSRYRHNSQNYQYASSLKENAAESSVKYKNFPNSHLYGYLDHAEGAEDSKSPFTVENEKVEKLRRNEIINCICGITEEDGLMIQCDLCLCWQHGHCMDILRDADVPDKYICTICKNPFRGRLSMKYLHDQEWLKEGTLPSLSFRSKREDVMEQRRNILKRSYDLSGSISLLSKVIHSLRVKVNIAEKKDHPKLWLWAKKWNEKKPARNMEDVKEEKPTDAGSAEQKTEDFFSNEEQQLPKVPEPEAPIDSAECRLNLLDHLIHYQTLVDARLSCIESLVAELESMQDDIVDDEGPDNCPRTKATVQMILRDLNTMNKIADI